MQISLEKITRRASGTFQKETKTLGVVVATEAPFLRDEGPGGIPSGPFYEVLDCSPENVDLTNFVGGPFLDEHQDTRHLGIIEGAEVCEDRAVRAKVKFGPTALAEERFAQMSARVRPFLSAGYKWTKVLSVTRADDGKPVYRFAWRALEVSSVALPADRSAQVGRSNKQKVTMKENIEIEERDDISEIRHVAGVLRHDFPDLVEDVDRHLLRARAENWDPQTFKQTVMASLVKSRAIKPAKRIMLETCTDTEGARNYSILRGIQSCLKRQRSEPDGLEGEVHQEMLRQASQSGGLGYEAQGYQVPCDAPLRLGRTGEPRMQRDMQATIFGQGGAFVSTNMSLPAIDLLRNRIVLSLAGMRTMAGLTGNIVIPRQEAAATAYSVSEIGLLTDSMQVLGQIAMSPKRVGATQTYSKQFVLQSSPDAEVFLRDDLLKVIALDWDRLGLNGSGAANEPLGIMNTPGIASIVFGAAVTLQKLISMKTALAIANADVGVEPGVFITTPTVKGILEGAAFLPTGATVTATKTLWEDTDLATGEGRLVGRRAFHTNQVLSNLMLHGAFSQLVQGMWGGLDVVVDQFTKAKNAETVITINTWGDFAVRHPQAFCVSADSAAQ